MLGAQRGSIKKHKLFRTLIANFYFKEVKINGKRTNITFAGYTKVINRLMK